ncbi:PASTA domain-containing protein [uncultured Roseibium sp.]|uniref:PASTA domain-containing protein n=1 Tax=uncultured Roseibium sp. TaxID=1936171 RepID=UPI0032174B4A
MPVQPPLILDSYAYRLGAELVDECVSQNVNKTQAVKYAALALASFTPHPAAPAAWSYAGGEVSSDALKCVAKAIVDASEDLTAAQKAQQKSLITGAFALKDWNSFADSLKGMSSPKKVEQTKAIFETVAATYERGSEFADLLQMINDTIESNTNTVKNYIFGEAETLLDAYDYAKRSCRYEEANRKLEEAQLAAKRECRGYGDRYRQAELSLRTHIYRFRPVLTDALTDAVKAVNRNAAEDTYVNLAQSLEFRRRDLERFVPIFDRLKKEKQKLRRERADFEDQQREYKYQVRLIRRVMDTPGICDDFSKLEELDKAIAPECRPAFFAGAGTGEMSSAGELGLELANASRLKSSAWWSKSDEIYKDFRACHVDAAKSKIAALKAEISSNPPIMISNGECKPIDQQALLTRLNGMSAPSYCFERPVPHIIGLTYDDAVDDLYEAGLQPGDKTRTAAARDGQKAGTVVDADPAEGSMQKAGTKVMLTVAKAEPAAETATMPEVIGIEKTVAADRVSTAGLIPVVDDSKAADKREYEPGKVYAASAKEGDELPLKFEITLSAYGPRPMVVIPGVAGKPPATAKSLLAGKDFTVGDPVPGDAATGDQVPGDIYGTNPPEGDEAEMFSEVTILAYGEPKEAEEDLRAIPSVIGQTVGAATGTLAGEDNFFSVGGVYLGEPAPADKKPGTVSEMVPGAGSMESKGTKVDLTLYGPHSDQPVMDEPPAETPPTEGAEVSGDDGGWLGRWRIHGVVDRKGKRNEIDAIMDIANREIGLTLTLFNRKNGELKKTITLPIRVVDGVILARAELLKQGTPTDDTQGGIVAGTLKKPLSKIAKMLQQLFETLRITREGEQCTLTFQDDTGQQVMPFQCVRIADGGQ